MVRTRKASIAQHSDEHLPPSDQPHNDDPDPSVHQGLLSGQPSTPLPHDRSPPSLAPVSPRTFVLLSLFASSLMLGFFSFAPLLRKLSTYIAVQPQSTQSRPLGPPGSITSKTANWAGQGGAWNDVDLEAAFKKANATAPLFNGTHRFRKTVIVVSLDGFRADYLDRNLTPLLISMGEKGIRAKGLKPQFPSLTFPNHWSIVTGLDPESHGMVSNNFWDPVSKQKFLNTDPSTSWDAHWWGGEPLWATAVKNHMRTAVMMWPGPPYTSEKVRPTFWRAFQEHFKWSKRIRLLENWIDMPVQDRPELVYIYVPDIDEVGHLHGPENVHMNETLRQMDMFAGLLDKSLRDRNLSEIVDVIYVSDHGMSASSDQRVIYLDEILGRDTFLQLFITDGWPAAGLRFREGFDTQPVLEKLLEAAKKHKSFEVYTHETMPKKWHFSNNDRIAPIYIVPYTGWVISTKHEHKVVMKGHYRPKGVHGYDNDETEMQGIFLAYGPSFRARQDKPADLMETFSNLEIYGLVVKLLGIENGPENNSTKGFWDSYL